MTFGTSLSSVCAGLMLGLWSALPAQAASFDPAPLAAAVQSIETRLGARVGVAVLDPASGTTWDHHGNQRFPMNSTMKAFACAALLHQVDEGQTELHQPVAVSKDDIIGHSPVTKHHAGTSGLRFQDVCRAAVSSSDNAAANLVLKEIGGPVGLTAYFRMIGDRTSRIDRPEPTLNEGKPGDPRDTTTPLAAARSLQTVVLGEVLSRASRGLLTDWLKGNTVGGKTLRAGLPDGWVIADKTGAGGYGARGNIAIVWPPQRAPVAIAVYITETEASFDERNRAIADVGRALAQALLP